MILRLWNDNDVPTLDWRVQDIGFVHWIITMELNMQNRMINLSAGLCILMLGACNKSASENLADRVENAADVQADAMENQAEVMANQAEELKAQADQVRETGEQRSDAIDAADQNIAGMSESQAKAVVDGQAPAVR